jgi:UDPglucose--hexose-1-phosphate uridylyltransferase
MDGDWGLKLEQSSHRRFNPLTNEWVLVSPHRTDRPWQGAIETTPTKQPLPYDQSCYLCPGNERAGGFRNPKYDSTFIFDNDFAALKKEASEFHFDLGGRGLLRAEGERGICRVMCFSPRHDLTLTSMTVGEIEDVVRAWIEQSRELSSMQGIKHVQIFENRGEIMGASNPHPHCQIWATSSIPELPARELQSQAAYMSDRGSCLLCDYSALEQEERERVVFENDAFIALVPFWAVWPFEILLCGRRHLADFSELSQSEVRHLSALLKHIVSTYDRVFDAPFPYSMGFHQAPCDRRPHPQWHFHAHFYPPLLRSATIRKFMVGFEMLGTPQRDITPEAAAERLRLVAGKVG